jgi:hypothetical protein
MQSNTRSLLSRPLAALSSVPLTALSFVPLAAALAAGAEPLAAPLAGLATVRITGSALEPDVLGVDAGQHLVFRNESAAMARVELDLPRGTGLVCRAGREEALRARKFVVAGGDALECEAPSSRTRYRVFRSAAGGGSAVESAGEVAPAGEARR